MLLAVLGLLLGLLVIFAIIVANGFFVTQEFAFMSVDRNELRSDAEAGDDTAQRALKITKRTSFLLSGSQLGITVTGLMVGYVAEPLVGRNLGELLGGVGVPAALSITVGTITALAVATVVQMIFGELVPKNYAIAAPMKTTRLITMPTDIFLKLFGWLITFFDWSANTLLRLIGIDPVDDVDSSATPADLERIVTTSREQGALSHEMFLKLERALDLPEQDAQHAMRPRATSDTVFDSDTVGHVRDLMAQGHSRYPVVDQMDTPVGVVDLLSLLRSDLDDEAPVTDLMQDPVVVSELTPLPDALEILTNAEQRLACVINEHGGLVGVLTMEDLSEEVLGDVDDEHDAPSPELINKVGESEWQIDGSVPVDEVERATGLVFPLGDYETLSGFLIAQNQGLVDAGTTVLIDLPLTAEDFTEGTTAQSGMARLSVDSLERNVPKLVTITVLDPEDADELEADITGSAVNPKEDS